MASAELMNTSLVDRTRSSNLTPSSCCSSFNVRPLSVPLLSNSNYSCTRTNSFFIQTNFPLTHSYTFSDYWRRSLSHYSSPSKFSKRSLGHVRALAGDDSDNSPNLSFPNGGMLSLPSPFTSREFDQLSRSPSSSNSQRNQSNETDFDARLPGVGLWSSDEDEAGPTSTPKKGRKKKDTKATRNTNIVYSSPPAACSMTEVVKRKGRVVMPPFGVQEALAQDLTGADLDTLMLSDEVYNKELSWLAFNWRVLYTALDERTPLFERLRFVAITARNLDEFFCKRVGALKRQEAAGLENLIPERHNHWTPRQQLRMVAREVDEMVKAQLNLLQGFLLPALKKEGVQLLEWEDLSEEQKEDLREHFKTSLEPILTPLAVDPGHPFPFISNMTLSIAVELRDPLDDSHDFAIVKVPASSPRWKSLAFDEDDEHLRNTFIPVEQVIRGNLSSLFGGMEIISANFFRVTRNADVARNEEEAEDLLEMINDEMRERKFAPFVRLEVDCDMPDEMVQKLANELSLSSTDDVYRVCGPLSLGELDSIPVNFGLTTHMQYDPWVPLTHPRLQGTDIFEVIRNGDLLVHHPYHSFRTSTQAFVEAAVQDPKVRAIKATLYRTSSDSPVISALVKAAEQGKQVAVLVELKARFDEARNVSFAQKLEDAGCNVAYGLVGLKTHCKCTMVVREEDDGFRLYVHIGTGNYNPRTASVYTDFGLFSCKPELGQDVADLFKYLTGFHRQMAYNKILVAPGTMRREFVSLFDREIANAKAGLPAGVVVKCNGLDDPVMVQKIYEASMAGVKVHCIVRGMCRIRVGIPKISDNVRVVSIVGRFLEHHRIFRFENGGKSEVFIGSADWMSRNLTRRVEVVTPVEDENLKKELQDILDACLSDRRTAWEMRPDGRYELLGSDPLEEQKVAREAEAFGRLGRAAVAGLHQACIEQVARQNKKATKVRFKKKDGSAARPRALKR